jgi:hypothetical protein
MSDQRGLMNCHIKESKMDDKKFRARFERPYRVKNDGADPAGFTALDFVGALGSVGNALLYSRLFWPEFIEVDGMVFIKDYVDDLARIIREA